MVNVTKSVRKRKINQKIIYFLIILKSKTMEYIPFRIQYKSEGFGQYSANFKCMYFYESYLRQKYLFEKIPILIHKSLISFWERGDIRLLLH